MGENNWQKVSTNLHQISKLEKALFSLLENMRSDRLPSLCASAIDTCTYTIQSSYGPSVLHCVTFVERPLAKPNYVNLRGTFVGLAFCSQARFSNVKSKNKQMTT